MTVPAPTVHDTGGGRPVVLLHAFPLDASQWDHQAAALGDRYRCLRPDFWGFGASPAPPEGEVTLALYVDALLRRLDELGGATFAAAGLSMGGYVIFELLRRAPERLAALVLASTRATADDDQARQERLASANRALEGGVEQFVEITASRLLSERGRGDSHISDPVRGRVRRARPDGYAAAQRAMAARPDSSELLGSIAVPTLLVGGSEDGTTSPGVMATMAWAIPGARHEVIEGAGHLCNLEDPFRFTELVERFLMEAYPPS